MKRLLARIALLFAASLLLPLSAHAQLFRAYVASYGNDANSCTVSLPCRLLPAALNAVHDNGEIWMLDSANFNSGTVTVTKSVKIQAIPGQVGSIVPVATAPAMVLAPGVNVSLRNVAMVNNSNNPGTDGIQMTTGTLTVEESVIEAGTSASSGIYLNGTGVVSVHNSVFRNSGYGVYVIGGGRADISSTKFSNHANAGVYVDGNIASTPSYANVRDSYFVGGYVGVWVQGDISGATGRGVVAGSSIAHAQYGVVSQAFAGGTSIASVAGTTVTGAALFAFWSGGSGGTPIFETQGNNTVRGNASNTAGTITTFSGF